MTEIVPGSTQLAAYKAEHKLTHEKVAELLGCGASMAKAMVIGVRRPGLDLAIRIQDATGVPVESW